MSFRLFPAIDLRHGHVVRLTEGLDHATTRYSADPASMARRIQAEGAEALHVVDLDAAFRDGSQREIIASVVAAFDGPVQVGGGVRSAEDVQALLKAGVARVIIGSAAVDNPAWVREMVDAHGEAIVVGIDARDGIVRTHGWTESGGRTVDEVAGDMVAAGVREVVFTNIARDGRLEGPDLDASEAVARHGLRVVVSGGVGSLDHVRETWDRRSAGFSGLIIGKAFYEGALSLADAMEVCRAQA